MRRRTQAALLLCLVFLKCGSAQFYQSNSACGVSDLGVYVQVPPSLSGNTSFGVCEWGITRYSNTKPDNFAGKCLNCKPTSALRPVCPSGWKLNKQEDFWLAPTASCKWSQGCLDVPCPIGYLEAEQAVCGAGGRARLCCPLMQHWLCCKAETCQTSDTPEGSCVVQDKDLLPGQSIQATVYSVAAASTLCAPYAFTMQRTCQADRSFAAGNFYESCTTLQLSRDSMGCVQVPGYELVPGVLYPSASTAVYDDGTQWGVLAPSAQVAAAQDPVLMATRCSMTELCAGFDTSGSVTLRAFLPLPHALVNASHLAANNTLGGCAGTYVRQIPADIKCPRVPGYMLTPGVTWGSEEPVACTPHGATQCANTTAMAAACNADDTCVAFSHMHGLLRGGATSSAHTPFTVSACRGLYTRVRGALPTEVETIDQLLCGDSTYCTVPPLYTASTASDSAAASIDITVTLLATMRTPPRLLNPSAGTLEALPRLPRITRLRVVCSAGVRIEGGLPRHLVRVVPRAVELGMAGCGVDDVLPQDWAQLAPPTLRVLDLSSNALRGPLPAAWAVDPAAPTAHTLRLGVLNLSHNTLTGPLPPGWWQGVLGPALLPSHAPSMAAEAMVADLQHNRLTGPVPTQTVREACGRRDVSLYWGSPPPPGWEEERSGGGDIGGPRPAVLLGGNDGVAAWGGEYNRLHGKRHYSHGDHQDNMCGNYWYIVHLSVLWGCFALVLLGVVVWAVVSVRARRTATVLKAHRRHQARLAHATRAMNSAMEREHGQGGTVATLLGAEPVPEEPMLREGSGSGDGTYSAPTPVGRSGARAVAEGMEGEPSFSRAAARAEGEEQVSPAGALRPEASGVEYFTAPNSPCASTTPHPPVTAAFLAMSPPVPSQHSPSGDTPGASTITSLDPSPRDCPQLPPTSPLAVTAGGDGSGGPPLPDEVTPVVAMDSFETGRSRGPSQGGVGATDADPAPGVRGELTVFSNPSFVFRVTPTDAPTQPSFTTAIAPFGRMGSAGERRSTNNFPEIEAADERTCVGSVGSRDNSRLHTSFSGPASLGGVGSSHVRRISSASSGGGNGRGIVDGVAMANPLVNLDPITLRRVSMGAAAAAAVSPAATHSAPPAAAASTVAASEAGWDDAASTLSGWGAGAGAGTGTHKGWLGRLWGKPWFRFTTRALRLGVLVADIGTDIWVATWLWDQQGQRPEASASIAFLAIPQAAVAVAVFAALFLRAFPSFCALLTLGPVVLAATPVIGPVLAAWHLVNPDVPLVAWRYVQLVEFCVGLLQAPAQAIIQTVAYAHAAQAVGTQVEGWQMFVASIALSLADAAIVGAKLATGRKGARHCLYDTITDLTSPGRDVSTLYEELEAGDGEADAFAHYFTNARPPPSTMRQQWGALARPTRGESFVDPLLMGVGNSGSAAPGDSTATVGVDGRPTLARNSIPLVSMRNPLHELAAATAGGPPQQGQGAGVGGVGGGSRRASAGEHAAATGMFGSPVEGVSVVTSMEDAGAAAAADSRGSHTALSSLARTQTWDTAPQHPLGHRSYDAVSQSAGDVRRSGTASSALLRVSGAGSRPGSAGHGAGAYPNLARMSRSSAVSEAPSAASSAWSLRLPTPPTHSLLTQSSLHLAVASAMSNAQATLGVPLPVDPIAVPRRPGSSSTSTASTTSPVPSVGNAPGKAFNSSPALPPSPTARLGKPPLPRGAGAGAPTPALAAAVARASNTPGRSPLGKRSSTSSIGSTLSVGSSAGGDHLRSSSPLGGTPSRPGSAGRQQPHPHLYWGDDHPSGSGMGMGSGSEVVSGLLRRVSSGTEGAGLSRINVTRTPSQYASAASSETDEPTSSTTYATALTASSLASPSPVHLSHSLRHAVFAGAWDKEGNAHSPAHDLHHPTPHAGPAGRLHLDVRQEERSSSASPITPSNNPTLGVAGSSGTGGSSGSLFPGSLSPFGASGAVAGVVAALRSQGAASSPALADVTPIRGTSLSPSPPPPAGSSPTSPGNTVGASPRSRVAHTSTSPKPPLPPLRPQFRHAHHAMTDLPSPVPSPSLAPSMRPPLPPTWMGRNGAGAAGPRPPSARASSPNQGPGQAAEAGAGAQAAGHRHGSPSEVGFSRSSSSDAYAQPTQPPLPPFPTPPGHPSPGLHTAQSQSQGGASPRQGQEGTVATSGSRGGGASDSFELMQPQPPGRARRLQFGRSDSGASAGGDGGGDEDGSS